MCNSCVYQIALARMRCIMMRLHFRAVKTNTGMRVSGDVLNATNVATKNDTSVNNENHLTLFKQPVC